MRPNENDQGGRVSVCFALSAPGQIDAPCRLLLMLMSLTATRMCVLYGRRLTNARLGGGGGEVARVDPHPPGGGGGRGGGGGCSFCLILLQQMAK